MNVVVDRVAGTDGIQVRNVYDGAYCAIGPSGLDQVQRIFLDGKGFRAKRFRKCRFAVELITEPSDPVLLDLGLKVQARFLDDGGIQCQ